MSAVLERADPMVALSAVHAGLDELAAVELTGLGVAELLGMWRELERLRRRIPSVEHGLVLEAEAQGLPEQVQVRGVAQLLRGLLRLDPHEAAGRVRAAHAAGARRTITGEPLPAAYPALAAAQADGRVSERQARVIVDAIEKLPDSVRDEHAVQIESELVGYAGEFDPVPLAKLADRIRYRYDPDGALEDLAYRDKHRELTVRQRVDGSSSMRIEATAELTELVLTHCDALAKPLPATDGVKDPRTARQRRHDALLEALKRNVRARELPTVGGVSTTLVITMTAEQFETRQGLATTGHGALVPVPEAMRIAAAEYRLMNVVIDKTKGITGYSSVQRLFTEAQRLAMIAADGPGCSFPQCPVPAAWCEADHVIDHASGGPTRVDFGVLACGYHNIEAKKQGWRSTRVNGRAGWIPPPWIDPEQKPRYNQLHRTEPP
ncbi:MAG TPA: DUF222 domain-containing protein [Jatrophihabitans sp.]|jgi:hypothetical protein|nr:DUF222 domain-containing protein [Jatrophihabitans sp.]